MNSDPTAHMLCADLRSMDPVSYITAIGLQPEDSHGFLPVEQSDGSALVYIYRDRPRYAEVRDGLPLPQRSRLLGGMLEVDRPADVEIDLGGFAPADASAAVADALALAQSLGAPSVPPPPRLAADPATAARPSAPIASHRIYPGLRTRSSGKQLNHFLPRYAENVGIHAEDVFGVFPRGIHHSGGSSAREWQSMWLVYRDRPEYAHGRERWAAEMAKRGGWPDAELSRGSEAPPRPASGPASVEVRRVGWPKRNLLSRETGENLGPRLIEAIGELGYGPDRALGLCPDYDQRKLYFAWTRG
jgi:hypothetical protein